jgi:hypothetical protein
MIPLKSFADVSSRAVLSIFAATVGLEKKLADLKEVTQYLMDIYIP